MVTIALIEQTNHVLAMGSVALLCIGLFLLFDLKKHTVCASFIRRFGLSLALALTLIGSVLTLVYSEIFGLLPCGLCWIERMMLWTQVPLLLTALYYNDRLIARYGIVLSSLGLLVSAYHHYIQMGGSAFIACPSSGGDCAKRFMFEFGFVTFPFLAVVLFAFLIALYRYILKVRTGFTLSH